MTVAGMFGLALASGGAKADILSITPAGAADGFSLASFITGFPSPAPVPFSCCGPLGLAVEPNGNVLVDSSQNRTNYVFADTDGQTVSNALSSTPFNAFPPAYAASNGYTWGSWGFEGSGSGLVRFNPNGTVAASSSNIPITNGLWRNPITGDLLGAGSMGIVDINVSNPNAPTFRLVTSASSDGVTVSPDGKTVYTTGVAGYDIATGDLVFGPTALVDGLTPDGMAVISSSNSLNGDIVVNTNNGDVVLIDPTTGNQTIIASGGSRGDYAAGDPSNGTLLLTQTDSIDRLSCGSGCGIGVKPPPVPEPGTLALLGAGVAGLVAARRRRAG